MESADITLIAFFTFWLALVYGGDVVELVKLWIEKRNK